MKDHDLYLKCEVLLFADALKNSEIIYYFLLWIIFKPLFECTSFKV